MICILNIEKGASYCDCILIPFLLLFLLFLLFLFLAIPRFCFLFFLRLLRLLLLLRRGLGRFIFYSGLVRTRLGRCDDRLTFRLLGFRFCGGVIRSVDRSLSWCISDRLWIVTRCIQSTRVRLRSPRLIFAFCSSFPACLQTVR